MSVTEQERPNTGTSSQYVDFDEYIEYQLKKTRAGIHQTDLLIGGLTLCALITGYLLLFAIFDQWIIPGGFSATMRVVLLGILGVSVVTWVGWKILLPYFRSINAMYAAREIERTHPEFKSSLMTWVDFRRSGREIPQSILSALEKRTAQQIAQTNVDEAVDRRLLMKVAYLLLGLVVLFCLYTLFSPKRMTTTLWRALMPFSSVAAATRTEIFEVKPGDTEVLARDQLNVSVELAGHIPPEVTLFFSTADRRFVNEPLMMRPVEDKQNLFQTRLTGDAGRGLLSDVKYHIVAGDTRSRSYDIRVNQPPTAEVTEITYDYPQYMGLERTTQQSSVIDAWEGTWVTVTARPNMPIKRAVIYCSDQETIEETAEAYPMQVLDDRLSARWQLKFRDDGTFARYFHVQVWNERNQKDPQPTLYRIKVRPDLKPDVTLVHPERDQSVPANATIPVGLTARDPDFLLRRVSLKLQLNGEDLLAPPPLFTAPPEVAEYQTIHKLDLAKLNVKAGDQIALYVEAEDNFEPFGKRQKNISRSPRITLTVVAPVPPEEKKQLEQKQNDELQNKLQQADPNDRARMNDIPQEPKPDQPQEPQKNRDQQQQQKPGQEQMQQKGGEEGKNDKPQEGKSQDGMPQEGAGERPQEGQPQGTPQQQPQQKQDKQSQQQPDQKGATPQEGAQGESGQEGMPSGNQQGSGNSSGKQNSQNPSQPQQGEMQDPKGTPQGAAGERQNGGTKSPNEPRPDKVGEDQALQRLLDWSRKQNEGKKPEQSGDQPKGDQPQSGPQSPPQQNGTPPQGNDGMKPGEERSPDGMNAPKPDASKSPSAPNAEGKSDPQKAPGQTPDSSQPDEMKSERPQDGAGMQKPSSPEQSGNDQSKKPTNSPSGGEGEQQKPNQPSGKPGEASNNQNNMGQKPDSNSPEKSNPEGMNRPSQSEQSPNGTGKNERTEQGEKGKSAEEGGGMSGKKPDSSEPGKEGPASNNSSEKPSGDQKSPSQSPSGRNDQQPRENSNSPNGMQRPENAPMESQPGQAPSKDQQAKDQQGMNGQNQPAQNQQGQNQPGQNQPGQQQPGNMNQQGQNQNPPSQPGQSQPGQPQQGQSQNGQSQPGQQPNQQQPGGMQQPGQQNQNGQNQPGQQPGNMNQQGQNSQNPGSGTQQQGQPSEGSPQQPGNSNSMNQRQPGGESNSPMSPDSQSMPQNGSQQQPGQNQSGQQQPGNMNQQGQQQQGQQNQNQQGQGPNQQQGMPQQQGGQKQNGQQGNQQGGQQQGQQGGQQGQQAPGNPSGTPSDSQPGGQQGMPSQQPGGEAGNARPSGVGSNQAPSNAQGGSAGNNELLTPDQADLANRKKATELALKQLKDQLERGAKPEELMKELGFTDQDLDRFMNRLEERLADPGTDRSAESEAARRQFESILKGLQTGSGEQLRGSGDRERKASQSFGSGNRPIPPEYRRDTEAYKQKLSK